MQEVYGFYVHPKTGILGFVARESKRQRDRQKLEAHPLIEIPVDAIRSYRLLEGLWYFVTHELVHVPPRASCLPTRWDAAVKKNVRLKYGLNRVGIAKKQCSREELKVVRYRIAQWEWKVRHM